MICSVLTKNLGAKQHFVGLERYVARSPAQAHRLFQPLKLER